MGKCTPNHGHARHCNLEPKYRCPLAKNLVELPAIGINLNGRQTFDMQVQARHQCLTCLCERFPKLANAVSAENKYCSNDLIAGFPVCPLFAAHDFKNEVPTSKRCKFHIGSTKHTSTYHYTHTTGPMALKTA